MKWYFKNNKLS